MVLTSTIVGGELSMATGVALAQKMGKGAASTKSRHGLVKPMNLDHTNVNVTVEDRFAGEWIDDFDQLRINHSEMQAAQQSGAFALGRETDNMIRDAALTTSSTANETTNGATLAWATGLMESFGNNDVPDDGRRYVFLGWENWSQMLAITQFASQDYVPSSELPFSRGTMAKSWLGFIWSPFSGLTEAGGGADRVGLAYHYSALGHAIGEDVSTNAQYYNERDSWFVLNKMQMQAVLIDLTGCFTCQLKK